MRLGLPAALLALSTLPLAAAEPGIASSWRGGDVVVDGDASDWSGVLRAVPGQPVELGVRNDGAFLWVCLRATDERVRQQVLGLGLTFWLDAGGKEARSFGVRYPAGPRGLVAFDVPDDSDPAMRRGVEEALAGGELRIVGTRDEGARLKVAEAAPIEAALGEREGSLVIELKVPLAFGVDAPHAIEAAPGSTLALGLETSEPKGKSAGSGGRRGGRGGRGFPGPGRGDEPPRVDEKAFGRPLKVWLAVPLAAGPGKPAS